MIVYFFEGLVCLIGSQQRHSVAMDTADKDCFVDLLQVSQEPQGVFYWSYKTSLPTPQVSQEPQGVFNTSYKHSTPPA